MVLQRRSLLLAALAASGVGWAAAPAPDKSWRDPLDLPATPSAYASRGLINGLALADQRIVAVGWRGHALWSDDAGKNWQQASVPVSSDLTAVAFAGAKQGWTVGHDGVVLHSADGGKTWVRQLDGRALGDVLLRYYSTLGDPKWLAEAQRFAAQVAENPFLDVWFQDERTGYIVGAFGLLLRTSDGGAHWEPLLHSTDNPKGLHLYAVHGFAGDIYLAGEQGLLLKLDPVTGRFRALELPYKGTLFGLVGHAGALIAYGLRGKVLRSTNAGRSWQDVTTGVAVGLTAGTVDAAGRVLLVSQAGHVLVSHDDGASFALAKVDRPMPATAVLATGPGAVLIAGPRGTQSLALP
jgi:photosystem II stability/assembly factor-like uncharacterized protein